MRVPGRSDHAYAERAQAVDAADHRIAAHDGAHAFRRAGVDQVARLQAEVLGQVGDGLGDGPDQLADVAALLVRAIDL
ncbi:hypothetical protein G6F58_013833 [Rhizopus delemar]|nr:hypothetical protein G6F58_013833 [Rhizopus delemar]